MYFFLRILLSGIFIFGSSNFLIQMISSADQGNANSGVAVISQPDPIDIPPAGYFQSSGGVNGSFRIVKFDPSNRNSVDSYDLLRKGTSAFDGLDLNEESKLYRIGSYQKNASFEEFKLTPLEDAILSLADYPAQVELRTKLIGLIDESNFDLEKLYKSKAFSKYLDQYLGKKNIREFLNVYYPGLVNDAGAFNMAMINEAKEEQFKKSDSQQTVIQCSDKQEQHFVDSSPCSFSNLWKESSTKLNFSIFKDYFHANKTINTTYLFIKEIGNVNISAQWKFDGKGYVFKSATLSSKACLGGVGYDLFANPMVFKELMKK